MNELKTRYQAQLQSLYGLEMVEFPDSLFWFCEFVLGLSIEEQEYFWGSLCNIEPVGPLYFLLQLAEGTPLDQLMADFSAAHYNPLETDWSTYWLEDQYYDDPPEFLTCLTGEIAGEHWGLLLDDPALGFKGVGMFYNGDGSEIGVCESILAAISERFEEVIENYADEKDNEGSFLVAAQTWQPRFDQFIIDNELNLDDGRPVGIESDTGLSIIPSDRISAEQNELAVTLLKQGRSLWFWDKDTQEKNRARLLEARDLMKRAYEIMDRPKLVNILNAVYESKIYMVNGTGWEDQTGD
jgi:hypothetical protein